jgi:hypothetical protein
VSPPAPVITEQAGLIVGEWKVPSPHDYNLRGGQSRWID